MKKQEKYSMKLNIKCEESRKLGVRQILNNGYFLHLNFFIYYIRAAGGLNHWLQGLSLFSDASGNFFAPTSSLQNSDK